MSLKKCLLIAFSIIMLFFLFFTFLITRVDYNDKMPTAKQEVKKHSFHLINHIVGLEPDNLINKFPYRVFADSVDICSVNAIKECIQDLDGITGSNILSQEVVSVALTDSLYLYSNVKKSIYNPDSLILALEWIQRFKYYPEIDTENEILYQVVNDYWMSEIANIITKQQKNNYWLKYDYKFKYISSRLEIQGYNTNIGFNDFEKVINNMIESNFSYVYDRFCTRTSAFQKMIILLPFLFFIFSIIYGYYCMYIVHKKK